MAFTFMRATEAFFALVRKTLSKLLEHRDNYPEYPEETLKAYLRHSTLLALCWGLGGDIKL